MTSGDAAQRKAYFCRLFTEATLGGMAFEVVDRRADDPRAALLAATEGYIPVRASTPDELRAALNIIAADFAVHLGTATPGEVAATAEELRQVGAHWLAHVIRLVSEASAPMRADGNLGAASETEAAGSATRTPS